MIISRKESLHFYECNPHFSLESVLVLFKTFHYVLFTSISNKNNKNSFKAYSEKKVRNRNRYFWKFRSNIALNKIVVLFPLSEKSVFMFYDRLWSLHDIMYFSEDRRKKCNGLMHISSVAADKISPYRFPENVGANQWRVNTFFISFIQLSLTATGEIYLRWVTTVFEVSSKANFDT